MTMKNVIECDGCREQVPAGERPTTDEPTMAYESQKKGWVYVQVEILSPPHTDADSHRWHLCRSCYLRMLNAFNQGEP